MNTEEENPKVNKVAKKTVSKLPDDALIESAKRAQWREERRAGQTYKESGIEE